MKKNGGLMAVDKIRERERLDVGVCMSRYHDLKKKEENETKWLNEKKKCVSFTFLFLISFFFFLLMVCKNTGRRKKEHNFCNF